MKKKKNIDQNMNLRNALLTLDSYLSMAYTNYSQTEAQKNYLINYFYVLTFTNKYDSMVRNVYANMLDPELIDFYSNSYMVRFALISLVIINDLYIKLCHNFSTGRLTSEDEKLFKMIVNAINKKDTTILLSNANTISKFIEASREFFDATAFEKIALLSSLDEEDMEILSNFNPFFKEEYDHYNVELNEDFFIRQINKWINGEQELNTALEKAAEFIIDMSYTDPDKIDGFIDILSQQTDESSKLDEAIANGDIEFIKSILNKFYEENKEKTLKR